MLKTAVATIILLVAPWAPAHALSDEAPQSVACRPDYTNRLADNADYARHVHTIRASAEGCQGELVPAAGPQFSNLQGLRGTLATAEMAIGNWHEAACALTFRRPESGDRSPERKLANDLRPVAAVEALAREAQNHQAFFLNEKHHEAKSRILAAMLLKPLWDLGYRYFAAEALSHSDDALGERGYALLNATGHYLSEPVFANLFRHALALGYRVIPYEVTAPCPAAAMADDPYLCMNRRDERQARNLIAAIFSGDPEAKIFVYAGYGHIAKAVSDRWKPMAVYFQELAGIEPFSVDQTIFMGGCPAQPDTSFHRRLVDRFALTGAPAVLVTPDDGIWRPNEVAAAHDAVVIWPPTRLQDGRPHWMSLFPGTRSVSIPRLDACPRGVTCVVQAFAGDEGAQAIPLDQVEHRDGRDIHLYVPERYFSASPYILRTIDSRGNIVAVKDGN